MLHHLRLFIVVALFLAPQLSSAATLLFSPSSGRFTVGNTFSVSVVVSSADQAMNAASAEISFPTDKLSVTSISKSNSIVNFWVQEPSYSNSAGTVSMEGVVLNPGYIGSSGRIATVTFRVKAPGLARVSFSSSSVLANDGLGTSILTSSGSGQYTLLEAAVKEETPAPKSETAPGDTEKPSSFTIEETPTGVPGNPKAKFTLKAEDKGSGIDHYELQVDTGRVVTVKEDGKNIFETDTLLPGEHTVFGRAFDKVGNYLVGRATFNILALNPPKFVSYERDFKQGDVAVVRASTEYRDVTGVLTFANEGDETPLLETTARVQADGTILFVTPMKLEKGVYRMWAKVRSDAGGLSDKSEVIRVSVPEGWWVTLGKKTVTALSVLIPIVALVTLLVLLFWYGWHRYYKLRRKMRHEAAEAEVAAHKAFSLLREDLHDLIVLLRKTHLERKLTKEETEVLRRAKKAYDEAEEYIEKEIKDIEGLS